MKDTFRLGNVMAVVTIVGVVTSMLWFGLAFAALPDRVVALERRMEVLEKELKDGRSDRLRFQGDTKSDLSRIEAKLDSLKESLELHRKDSRN